MNSNILICVIGPSGCGKTMRVKNYVKKYPRSANIIVGDTTRPKREDEIDGVEYNFVNTFSISEYIESVTYNNHLYGVSKEEFERKTKGAPITFFVCDSEGYNLLRTNYPNTYGIYIKAYSSDCIKNLMVRERNEEKVKNRVFYDASINAYSLDEFMTFDVVIKKNESWEAFDESFENAVNYCLTMQASKETNR